MSLTLLRHRTDGHWTLFDFPHPDGVFPGVSRHFRKPSDGEAAVVVASQ
ncbi:MAG: hypothetical protein ABGY24_04080 [bacterium]